MATYDHRPDDDRDRVGAVPPYQGRPAGLSAGAGIDPRTGAPLAGAPAGAAPVHRRPRGAAFWAAVAVLLLVIGWGLTRLGRNTDPEVAVSDPSGTPVATTVAGGEVLGATDSGGAGDGVTTGRPATADASAITRFVAWAGEGGNQALPQESEGSHPYMAQGLRLLADALAAATAGQGGDHAALVTRIRGQADLLQVSPDGDRHSEYAHTAFMDAARVIGDLRGGEARAELTAAAARVQTGRALSPQGEHVRAYFRQAATAMQGLTAPAGR